jgi:hypothetical protein
MKTRCFLKDLTLALSVMIAAQLIPDHTDPTTSIRMTFVEVKSLADAPFEELNNR